MPWEKDDRVAKLLYELDLIAAPRDCPDCGAKPGNVHRDGCDVERCSVCAAHWIDCGCKGHDEQFARWTGFWPGELEAIGLGLVNGWRSDPEHPVEGDELFAGQFGADVQEILDHYSSLFFLKPRYASPPRRPLEEVLKAIDPQLFGLICDVVQRAYERWPVDSYKEDPFLHTSDYARAAARRIVDRLALMRDQQSKVQGE